MPTTSDFDNIMLTYPQPHVLTFVQDNTVYTEDFLEPDAPVKVIQLIVSGEGRDNTLLYYTTKDQLEEELGKPNYALYGQSLYNAYRVINSGYGAVYGMRVMPADATYSNVVVMAKFKVIEVDPVYGEPVLETIVPKYTHTSLTDLQAQTGAVDGEYGLTTDTNTYYKYNGTTSAWVEYELQTVQPVITPGTKKLAVSYTAKALTGATSDEEVNLKLDELMNLDPDDDGYMEMPFMMFRSLGRGSYGDKFRIKFVDATEYDDPENTIRTYRLDVLKLTDVLTRKESIYGTLDETSYDTELKQSLYIQDIVNDPETGSNKISVDINQFTLETMLELYNTEVAGVDGQMTTGTFDPIFGKLMTGETNDLIKFEQVENGLELSSIDGFGLHEGSDGVFSTNAASQVRDQEIEDCLISALNGEYDKLILSRYSTPADIMFDANFSDAVKRGLGKLALRREYDAMTYLDGGLISDVDQMIIWLEEMKSVSGTNIIKEPHHFKIRDTEYTGKTIPVTMTYYLADALIRHLKTKGLGEPFARSNAQVMEAIRGSFKPVIDPVDQDVKKQIYLLRGNCYETVRYNVFQRTTCITSQLVQSDLSDEFNVFVLHLAVKECEDILNSKMYNLAEEEDRARYQKDAERRLKFTLGGYVRSMKVEYRMTARDEIRSILRLRLQIVFKTRVKRGIVEVIINPRATE